MEALVKMGKEFGLQGKELMEFVKNREEKEELKEKQ